MAVRIHPIATPYFLHDGRGPTLVRWLRDSDLYLPGTWDDPAPLVGDIVGAQYLLAHPAPQGAPAWAVFHGLQVLQIVPEEVHTYWHLANSNWQPHENGIWQIENSPWLASFDPRHLTDHQHFVLEWYDEIVEVICRELIVGAGVFDLQTQLATDSRFAGAYLRRAETSERREQYVNAIADLERYITMVQDATMLSYARRRLDHLRAYIHTDIEECD